MWSFQSHPWSFQKQPGLTPSHRYFLQQLYHCFSSFQQHLQSCDGSLVVTDGRQCYASVFDPDASTVVQTPFFYTSFTFGIFLSIFEYIVETISPESISSKMSVFQQFRHLSALFQQLHHLCSLFQQLHYPCSSF